MTKSIYLINPASDHPHYSSYEVYGSLGLSPAMFAADLPVTTLAAMAPEDFHVEICEETVTPVDLEISADYIGITGKINQWGRMKELAQEYRKRGKTVIIGGPHASLAADIVRPYCDILVKGEIEEIYPTIFSDLRNSSWKDEYVGESPDLSHSVIPKYELYPNNNTFMGSIQTGRGCPYSCEFCSVIQYNGRRQRHKPISIILREMDKLYSIGYRSVFITDDNFCANRNKAKEKAEALKHWNNRQTDGKVTFFTQVSIDVVKDAELLGLLTEAGISLVFVGIETINQESLKETTKTQNLDINYPEQIDLLLQHGITVTSGLIAGFDSDGPDIFKTINDFAMSLPIPYYNIDSLSALPGTPLYKRLKRENRLKAGGGSETSGLPWTVNFIPQKMSEEELYHGMKWLCSNLYHPISFEERILHFLNKFNFETIIKADEIAGPKRNPSKRQTLLSNNAEQLVKSVPDMGEDESAMFKRLSKISDKEPFKGSFINGFIHDYVQTRHVYDHRGFYDAKLIHTAFQ